MENFETARSLESLPGIFGPKGKPPPSRNLQPPGRKHLSGTNAQIPSGLFSRIWSTSEPAQIGRSCAYKNPKTCCRRFANSRQHRGDAVLSETESPPTERIYVNE